MHNKIILLLLILISFQLKSQKIVDRYGAIIRSDTSQKSIYLCFSGHDFNEGFHFVLKTLKRRNIKASFFLTGSFIENNRKITKKIIKNGHYLGAHSHRHLLYCDWTKRDSLLLSSEEIHSDIANNLNLINDLGLHPTYFMPPFEWYNASVVEIANELGQTTVNFTPGTRSNADYTSPEMKNYINSESILESIYKVENLNGFHLLIHPGTSPQRKDKLYLRLDELIQYLSGRSYTFKRFN